MRCLAIAIVVGTLGTAHADRGYFLTETFGASLYRGDLRAYGHSAMRVEVGFEVRDGNRGLKVVGGGPAAVEGALFCVGDQCGHDPLHEGGWFYMGVDVVQRWTVFSISRGVGLRLGLHGGPRYVEGGETLTGFRGLGLSGGATVEWDFRYIGFYVDTGVDAVSLSMPVDGVTGTATYLSFGVKVGRL